MAGGYRGGSTLIKTWPAPKSKPKTLGLIERELKRAKTGLEPDGPLVIPKAKPTKKQKRSSIAQPQWPECAPSTGASLPAAISAVNAPIPAKPAAGFSPSEVLGYLASYHPACPKRVRKRVGQIALEGRWTSLPLDLLTKRCAEHYVISEVCGLFRLIECGIPASAANRLIEPQRKAVMALWGF